MVDLTYTEADVASMLAAEDNCDGTATSVAVRLGRDQLAWHPAKDLPFKGPGVIEYTLWPDGELTGWRIG